MKAWLKKSWIWIMLVIAMIAILWVKYASGDVTSAQSMIDRYKVSYATDGPSNTLVQFQKNINIPQLGKQEPTEFEMSYSDETDSPVLTFMDTESDDLYWIGCAYSLANNQIAFQYSNQDEDNDYTSSAEVWYKVSKTGKLEEISRKISGNAHTGTTSQVKSIIKSYQPVIGYLVQRRMNIETMKSFTKYLHDNSKKVVKNWTKADDSQRDLGDKMQKERKQKFFSATFTPNYSKSQWKKYILERANQLGIRGAKIQVDKLELDTAAYLDYDYELTSSFGDDDSEQEAGYYSNDIGGDGDDVFTVIDANKVKYLVVLPLKLYDSANLDSVTLTTQERNYYYTMDGVDDAMIKAFVPADSQPTKAEITGNIVIAPPAK